MISEYRSANQKYKLELSKSWKKGGNSDEEKRGEETLQYSKGSESDEGHSA